MTKHIDEALIGYVMHYGGMCRDCADMDGVCQSGMPCDTDQRRAVIRHTIAALTYGIKHGFIENPFIAAALAAAEERGRMAEQERCADEKHFESGTKCRHCNGKGHQAGDPEGAPIEDCDYCGGSGKGTFAGKMKLFGHWSKHRLADGVFLPLVCYVPEGPDYTTVPIYAITKEPTP